MGLVRLGSAEFDSATGEIRRPGTADSEVRRLGPKPALLLTLLIERGGEILSREEIRHQLWPETHVDFDQNLNFCIRQIRSALGDSAAEQRYVETLPRRGYRLTREVEPIDKLSTPPHPLRRWPWIAGLASFAAIALLTTITLLAARGSHKQPSFGGLRLAIMPFSPPTDMNAASDFTLVAEDLLLHYGRLAPRLEVIGPRTTGNYDDSASSLRRLGDDLNLDYVLNGRFLDRDGTPSLLAELIRIEDGAHIWVEAFDLTEDWRLVAETIRREATPRLGLEQL